MSNELVTFFEKGKTLLKEAGQKNQQLAPYGNRDGLRGKETVITHEETGNTHGKHAATGGTLTEGSPKKLKSTMTTELSRGENVSFYC